MSTEKDNAWAKTRPNKVIFPLEIQKQLREKAIVEIKKRSLPDKGVIKIIMIGSSVKGQFGQYDPPGFRNSLFSDFDFIFIVRDDYEIPEWLRREISAKPFSDDSLNLAYRNFKLVDNKYDVEMFFMREKNFNNSEIVAEAERAGIPLGNNNDIEHLVVFENQ